MKKLTFRHDNSGFIVFNGKTSIGHVHKEKVGRSEKLCLVCDDLTWWRPDCLRQVADFIELQEREGK